MPYDQDPSLQTQATTTQYVPKTTTNKVTTTNKSETKESRERESIYDYAFVKKGSNYDIYILLDMDDMISRRFVTNGDTGIDVGILSGDIDSRLTITYDFGEEKWNE